MKKRKPKTERKKLIEELDRYFSLFIRKSTIKEHGELCPFCKKKQIEQCFHFITRAKHNTRWTQINAIGSCKGCNMEMEYNPHKFIKWFINQYGLEAYDNLILEGNKIAKFSNDDLKNKIIFFKAAFENA